MARTTTITKQDVINDVHRVSELTKTGKVRVTDYTKKGAFSLGTITRMFGSAKNDTFNQILDMDRNDDILDQSTLIMLTRKFVKQMEENGLEFDIETFEKTANFDVSMLAKAYGTIEEGLVAADVLMYVEYDLEDEEASDANEEATEDETDEVEDLQDEDNETDDEEVEEEATEDAEELQETEDDDLDDDLDEELDENDIDLSDFDLSEFDLDVADLNDDEAFYDAMVDSYEDDFYKEEDLKAAQMEMQHLFGGSRW